MKRTMKLGLWALGTTLLPLSMAQAAPGMEQGGMLVTHQGMTLYTYDKDVDGAPACYDKCATNWPPLMAEASAKEEGAWTVVPRKGGSKQWAYNGQPLYTFIQDKKPGDMVGEGKMDVWHMAKP